ncbi:hypothetical protein FHS95_003306 [Sphingomonas naasensis]|uniref:Uncharacterized protein n=1 Tax=Sphingomonas naasensis TaxID=1344951 RepID=A0A4S1WET7_9SPHN|nr:hypothetical protein [Sphingomonas naasensis]NIJ21603.1 hypothetical protein [Sphingomonas naasensis]TGX41459.1 hypothetical protein E5A74_12575 [Sphingomonas naasensis]
MRRLAAAIGIVLLLLVGGALGYDGYRKSSPALLARAKAHAMMPSCPGAQARWLHEREGGVDVIQWAEIRADNARMTAWAAALGRANSGFDCDTQQGHLSCSNIAHHRAPPAWGAAVDFLPDRAQLTLWS